jgi:transposase-like protein
MSENTADLTFNAEIRIGQNHFIEELPIKCPYEDMDEDPHRIVKNGKDTSTKDKVQQFLCKACGASFYARTSKAIKDISVQLKDCLADMFEKGDLSIKSLKQRLNLSQGTAGRLMKRIVDEINEVAWDYTTFSFKYRDSTILFVDETFIKIEKQTWYLILAINGDNKIMGFTLSKNRKFRVINKLIKNCEKRCINGLMILVTDGLPGYKGVARKIGHDIIHVVHLHHPPYGRIEIDIYKYGEKIIKRTTARSMNDIFTCGGPFLMSVSEKNYKKNLRLINESYTSKKKKKTSKKSLTKKGNVKKPGLKQRKRKRFKGETRVYFHHWKDGVIKVYAGEQDVVAASLCSLRAHFGTNHITTNLVEKEFSVLKKFLSVGSRRSVKNWKAYLFAYFTIRESPQLLEAVFKHIEIPVQIIKKSMAALIEFQVS